MSRPLTDFTGDTLYLDTMIPYALLRGIDPAAQRLFARIEASELLAYTSVLTFYVSQRGELPTHPSPAVRRTISLFGGTSLGGRGGFHG